MKNIFKVISLLVIVIIYTGCAQKAETGKMIAQKTDFTYEENLKNNIDVGIVSGGRDTNPMGASQIDNYSFKEAILISLKNEGLYQENSQYRLEVTIVNFNQPLFGLDMTVGMNVQYTLIDDKTGKIIWREFIAESFTAKVSDALAGIERLKLANEGAARKNIQGLLKKLSKYKVKNIAIN